MRKYGVPTGSTGAFTAGDLGGASAGLAGFVGRGPGQVTTSKADEARQGRARIITSADTWCGVSIGPTEG